MESHDRLTFPLNHFVCRSLEERLNADHEFRATASDVDGLSFGFGSSDGGGVTVFKVEQGALRVSQRSHASEPEPQFVLMARTAHWLESLAAAVPKRPFQSYWGMLRVLGRDSGVEVKGNQQAFTNHARLWRIVLDGMRATLNADSSSLGNPGYIPDDEQDDDSIIGHYTWLVIAPLGKCKIFYEVSGKGDQPVVFLHTAGADSRQYHSLMLNKDLQSKCTMYAFDLPGHGRSFPGATQYPLSYANSEEFYISCIRQFLQKLKIHRAVVSGASMGGQVCLTVALYAQELDVRGVIPCEACDYIPSQVAASIYSLRGDEGVLNAERVCGMISPTSPDIYKRLNWWIYSSQASRIFPGDLLFYFDGWDGRERMKDLDTDKCPVYMLTGEYDYSCSPEMSRKTAERIQEGGKGEKLVFEELKGLGHFPFSEDPERFIPYFQKALEYIWTHSQKRI